MNRKSGSNHTEILATSNSQLSSKKHQANRKINQEKDTSKIPTFAQLVSSSGSPDGQISDAILKSSTSKVAGSLNGFDSNSVVLPSVKLEPVPIPGIIFGNLDNKSATKSVANNSSSYSEAISGGIPRNLPKISVKPIFGNSSSLPNSSRSRSNSGASFIGPVPLPSQEFHEKDTQYSQTSTHFPDPNVSIKDGRGFVPNLNRGNKYASQYSGNMNHAKHNRPQISGHGNMQMPSPDDVSYRRLGSPSVNQNTLPHQGYPEAHNSNIINGNISLQSPYMTNTTPLPSVSSINNTNISSNTGGFHLQNQGIDPQQFSNYPNSQGQQHNMNTRMQPGANVNSSSMPYVQMSNPQMQNNRDKQIPSTPVSNPVLNVNSSIGYPITSANQGSQPHIAQAMPMPHSGIPGPINNVPQQPINPMGSQMPHWVPGSYYSPGHLGNPSYDSQYYGNGNPGMQQHMAFVPPNSFMINRQHPNMQMQQALIIGNPESSPQIVSLQQVPGINPLPNSPMSSSNKLNPKSTEFTPRSTTNKVRITDPTTKKVVDLRTKTYKSVDHSKPSQVVIPSNKKDFNEGEEMSSSYQTNPNTPEVSSFPSISKKSLFVLPDRTKAIKIINPKLSEATKIKNATENKLPSESSSAPSTIDENVSSENITADSSVPMKSVDSNDIPSTEKRDESEPSHKSLLHSGKNINIPASNSDSPKLPSITSETESLVSPSTDNSHTSDSIGEKIITSEISNSSAIIDDSLSTVVNEDNKIAIDKISNDSKLPIAANEDADIIKNKNDLASDGTTSNRSIPLSQENIAAETQRIVDELNKEKNINKETPPVANEVQKNSQPHTLSLSEMLNLSVYPDQVKDFMPKMENGYICYPLQFLNAFKIVKRSPGFSFDLGPSDDRSSGPIRDNRRGLNRNRSDLGRDRLGARSNNSILPIEMNVFKPVPRTSEERFQASVGQGNLNPIRTPGGLGGRTPSSGNRSSRMSRQSQGYRGGQSGNFHDDQNNATSPLINYEPLQKSENRWKPQIKSDFDESTIESINASKIPDDVVNRKVKALLNKLTVDNYDRVSPEIVHWANRSSQETGGRILKIVLNLIFEKAVDEPPFAAMYAKLSRLIHDEAIDSITLDQYTDKDGKPARGTMVVRKILLNRCQTEFESGWKAEIPDDIKSDEYYQAMKIKRRGLGLVKYVGELFLLNILSEKLVMNLIFSLLSGDDDGFVEDETIESAAKLITTVGSKIEENGKSEFLDVVCSRLTELTKIPSINSRIKFMLMDVIDLRSNKWVTRGKELGPKSISEIHADVERERAQQSNALRKNMSSSGRGPGMHGNNRGGYRNGDRSSYSGRSNNRNDSNINRNAGDLSNFGNLNRTKAFTSGSQPQSKNPFAKISEGGKVWKSSSNDSRGGKDDFRTGRNVTLSNSVSSSRKMATPTVSKPKVEKISSDNIYSALANDNDDMDAPPSPNLEPETNSISKIPESVTQLDSTEASNILSKDVLFTKAKSIAKEYIGIKDNQEFLECIVELGSANYSQFLSSLILSVLDFKTPEVVLISNALENVFSSSIMDTNQIKTGFSSISESLVDTSTDVPFAYKHYAILLSAANVSPVDLNDYLGDLVSLTDFPNPPPFDVVRFYLSKRSEVIGTDKLISELRSTNGKPFDISQYLPENKRDPESLKKILDFKSLLQFFPDL
ncbi:Eukaryotic translation initiation factor 4 gamma [Smittium mucronatum]|uniref:Eukaryotic translation initiation factor 4 gamma n=1 Tax=Smittium mucronatum TaxID=133383 RepID=A0A1R0GY92_9FUNG|nr:Eukaryotic translation initiation factor 4 gamma [Smittium mucronatum]